jgi:hypothetical protein
VQEVLTYANLSQGFKGWQRGESIIWKHRGAA